MSSKGPAQDSHVPQEGGGNAEIKPDHAFFYGRQMVFSFTKVEVNAQLFDYLVVQAGLHATGVGRNIEVTVQYEREANGAKVYQQYVDDKLGLFKILGASAHVRKEGDFLEVDSNLVPRCSKLDFPVDDKWFDAEDEIYVVVEDEGHKKPTDKLEYQLRFSRVVRDKEGRIGWEDIDGNIKWKKGCL